MNDTIKAVRNRIKCLEEAIVIGREYLETGKHANCRAFRPYFTSKVRGGKELPPHRDWVKNVFLRKSERELRDAEKLLRRLEREIAERAKDT